MNLSTILPPPPPPPRMAREGRPMKRTTILLTAVLVIAALPSAKAEDTSFNFDAWLNGLNGPSEMKKPEIGVRRKAGAFCERASMATCFNQGIFEAYIKNGELNTSGRPLTIGLSWMTVTGQSGHRTFDGSRPVIGINRSKFTFIVSIPDDGIAHNCNKLIVHVRSLMPDVYKTMPYTRGQGFDYVTYLDNDGGNPDAPNDERMRVAHYKDKFLKYCN